MSVWFQGLSLNQPYLEVTILSLADGTTLATVSCEKEGVVASNKKNARNIWEQHFKFNGFFDFSGNAGRLAKQRVLFHGSMTKLTGI
jgi:hypothetical protein